MSSSFHGVVYQMLDGDYTPVLLDAVMVQISAIDTSAVVSIKQSFSPILAPSPLLAQSYYVFPLPPHSTVCKFKMCAVDGRSITAVIEEFNQGRALRPDTRTPFSTENAFVVSLGKTNVSQVLEVDLTYVCELVNESDDGLEETRLEIPAYIGSPCTTQEPSSSTSTSPRVHIMARIQTAAVSVKVYSKNHATDTVLLPSSNDGQATVKYTSTTFLKKDFCLVIRTSIQSEASRCFAERRVADHDSVAMHLTFIPQFTLEAGEAEEYIFIIDRSGSMSGNPIRQATDTLAVLLQALPQGDTNFNVFGFGTTWHSIFSSNSSRLRTEETFQTARQHVKGMAANLGGTSMFAALSGILPSRNHHVSTSIFLLTDGQPTDSTAEGIIELVSNAVSQSAPSSPLRVYTLGIGCSSPEMRETCEGIARAGRGECFMVTDTSSIMAEFGRLFRIGRTFILRNVSIDWGLPPDAELHGAVVQQVPNRVSDLYPGRTATVFALIQYHGFVIPEYVVVKGQKDGVGEVVDFKVPVIEILWPEWTHFPLLHTAAARRLLADKQQNAQAQNDYSESHRQSIVQLSQQFQLVTPFTGFVPVEKFEKLSSPSPPLKKSRSSGKHRHNSRPWSASPFFSSRRRSQPPSVAPSIIEPVMTQTEANASRIASGARNISVTPIALVSTREPTHGPPHSNRSTTTGPQAAPIPSAQRVTVVAASLNYPKRKSTASLSSTEREIGATLTAIPSAPEPSLLISYHPTQTSSLEYDSENDPPSSPIDADSQRLILLRSADGSWRLSPEFTQIIGQHPFDRNTHSISNDTLWSTALAITYLKAHLKNQPDYLQLFVPNSMKFGYQAAAVSGDNFDDILRLADRALNGSAPDLRALELVDVEAEDDKVESLERPNLPVERPSLKPSRRWALTRTCTFISLVIPFVILLLTTLSTSVLPNVALFVVRGSNSQLRFGIWGVCVDDLSSIPLTRGACSVPQVFYSVSPQFFDAVGHPELSGIIPHRLMKVLILHPIATSLSYCVIFAPFIFHKSRRMAIIFLSLVLLTATISSVSLAVDVAVAIVARDRVCAVHSEGVRVEVGITTWMMLAVVMLYLWSATLLTLMFLKAYRTRY